MSKISYFLLLILILSCENNKSKDNIWSYPSVVIDKKEHNFGKRQIGDTVRYVFKIKNLSNLNYTIDSVAESCGCTTTHYSKSVVKKDKKAYIEIEYVVEENLGKVVKSIVVSDNTEDGFQVFYLKGDIVNDFKYTKE